MEGYYQVELQDMPVGEVSVRKEGLYYHFTCTVRLRKNSRYRLLAISNEKEVDLGLCIPQGDAFGLSTKIPVKRFENGRYQFVLWNRSEKTAISLDEKSPFPDLRILPDCRFVRENGKAVLINQKGSVRA